MIYKQYDDIEIKTHTLHNHNLKKKEKEKRMCLKSSILAILDIHLHILYDKLIIIID
jgi:hypothetical protein